MESVKVQVLLCFVFAPFFSPSQVENRDWEDISVAECRGSLAENGSSCIFVGDIGHNDDNGESYILRVIQIREPDTVADATYYEDDNGTTYTVLNYQYPSGNTPDAEAFVAFGDSIYIFTKKTDGSTDVWEGSLTEPDELKLIDTIVRASTNIMMNAEICI